MSAMQGRYRGGRIELDERVDWPDGSRVVVSRAEDAIGLNETEWVDTPEARAALLSAIDALEPLELTPGEEKEIAAAREAVRKVTLKAVRKQMGL